MSEVSFSQLQGQIVLAMLAQMAIAVVLVMMLPVPRILAMRAKNVALDGHGRPVFPKWATQVADCFNNQFQMPVLFYVLCLTILLLGVETQTTVWLAWAFVALRVAHAAIFVTTNFVPLRFLFYIASSVMVLSMMIGLARSVLGI